MAPEITPLGKHGRVLGTEVTHLALGVAVGHGGFLKVSGHLPQHYSPF